MLRLRGGGATPRLRLLCLPYAGGGATLFHRWSDEGLPGVQIAAVQLPGRQDRLTEPALFSVGAIVQAVIEAEAALPPLPLAVFGHSFGGLVAFEVAQALQAAGRAPAALVVAARRGPQLPLDGDPIHTLPDLAFLEAVHQRYVGSRTLIERPELRALALPPLRADYTALERYQFTPGTPLGAPVTVLRGDLDTAITDEGVAAWSQVAHGPPTVHAVHAAHFFVETHRPWTVAKVGEALTRALSRGADRDGS